METDDGHSRPSLAEAFHTDGRGRPSYEIIRSPRAEYQGHGYSPLLVGFTGASLVRICVARAALRSADSIELPLRFCR